MNAVTPLVPHVGPVIAINVRVTLLDAKPGFNPRVVFRRTPMEELTENIRVQGVIQSIAIRIRTDQPDRYWIIAGERRVRACLAIGLTEIPARVFDVTEEEAQEIAAAESVRDDLSYGEEALQARRMMIARKGDRLEAARRLGWGLKKFDARLVLSQATEDVLIALAEERIELGHAELLSPCPEATQNGTLKAILERSIPVAQLQAQLAAFTLDLSTACFDLAGCAACPHNTTRQASLFEQNVGQGRCTNRPCFQTKTEQHLEELRPALRDSYPTVRSDKECDPKDYTILLRADVGDAQFEGGCAQCPNFGCVLSSRIGEAGRVTKDVCFDLSCRARKVRDFKGAVPVAHSPPRPPKDHAVTTNRAVKAPAPKTGAGYIARKLQDRIDAVHRKAAATEVSADPRMTQVYAILALLRELGTMNSHKGDPLHKRGIARPATGDARTPLIAALYEQADEVLAQILAELAGLVACRTQDDAIRFTDYLEGTRRTLAVMRVDLSRHFSINAEFLSAHTKEQIQSVLQESGFMQHFNRLDQHATKKLMNQRHEDIVRTITDSNFDFKGFVPSSLRTDIK
jgi:ParB family chromosome partitioning protein